MTTAPNRTTAFAAIVLTAATIFALDQVTKFWVLSAIPLGGSWTLFPGLARLIRFTFVTNTGAAFGMFPQFGGFFMVVAVVVIAGIVLFFHHLPTGNRWVRLSLGLQLGGALGNLIDRLNHGFVVDFVDIGFWPIFNVADASIVLGVALLAYHLWDEDEAPADCG